MAGPVEFDRIEVIFATSGGRAIRDAARRAHVWAVYSEENERTANSLWVSNLRDKISITTLIKDATNQDRLETLLDLALEHHGEVSEIAVIRRTDRAETDVVMAELAYGPVGSGARFEYRKSAANLHDPRIGPHGDKKL